VARSVTVAKFLYSGFEPDLNMFRRKFVGADGCGYDLLRPRNIDREAEVVEAAVANDVRAWMQANPEPEDPVVAFSPRFNPGRAINWLPQIRIARVSRSYWKPELQRIHTRVRSEDGETINILIPARLINQLLQAFTTSEAETRARVHGNDAGPGSDDPDWPLFDLPPQ